MTSAPLSHLLETASTSGALDAVRSAVARSDIEAELASTSTIEQLGQMPETISRSSDSSSSQPPVGSDLGSLLVPYSLTIFRQPLAVVHAGRPYFSRYAARSLAALGSLKASTTAMVSPPEALVASVVRP